MTPSAASASLAHVARAGLMASTLAIVACASPPPPVADAPWPKGAVARAEDLELSGPGWTVIAARADLFAATARAEEPALRTPPRDGQPALAITARTSTWDLKARSARFEGEVHLMRGALDLRCQTLDVTLAAENDALASMVATGEVVVTHGPRAARAGTATLEPGSGKVVLRAGKEGPRPRLTEGASTLEGAVVELTLDDGRARCEGDATPCRLVVASP